MYTAEIGNMESEVDEEFVRPCVKDDKIGYMEPEADEDFDEESEVDEDFDEESEVDEDFDEESETDEDTDEESEEDEDYKSSKEYLNYLGDLRGKVMTLLNKFYDLEALERFANPALDKFNQDNGTDYKLEKIDRANWNRCGGVVPRYITFTAKESSAQKSVKIQAKVESEAGFIVDVLECQLSPDSSSSSIRI